MTDDRDRQAAHLADLVDRGRHVVVGQHRDHPAEAHPRGARDGASRRHEVAHGRPRHPVADQFAAAHPHRSAEVFAEHRVEAARPEHDVIELEIRIDRKSVV